MSVDSKIKFECIEQDGFHAIDKVVMGHAFEIHNTIGRFCNESTYKNELSHRCRISGLDIQTEVHLCVSHKDFVKSYYLDMLIQCGVIYELKAATTLNGNHQKQLINYLLLANINHGKLINFRPSSVESRFVSTRLDKHQQRIFEFDDSELECQNDDSCYFREILFSLLSDWGVFLDVNLYRDALLHFLKGTNNSVQAVDVVIDNRVVGTQKMCLLNGKTAWHLSAIGKHLKSYEIHIHRLLNHTQVERIHWVNINQQTVTIKTIKNDFAANDFVKKGNK